MKEYLKALLAGVGCTPILAVSLFIMGAFIGEYFPIHLPSPPQWLLIPAGAFPFCFSLYLRAVISLRESPDWLELWRRSNRQQIVGNYRGSVEDFWVQTQGRHAGQDRLYKKLLGSVKWWGWGALVSGLCLAYICAWYGLAIAAGG